MTILPRLDSVALEGTLLCSNGHLSGALAMAPIAQRSLRHISEVAQELPKPQCDRCGQPLELLELTCTFNEPGLPILTFEAPEGTVTCADEEIASEAQLVGLIGRPFSVADYHRARLSGLTAPLTYEPSPGVIVAAVPTSPDDNEQTARALESAMTQMMPLLEQSVVNHPPSGAPVPMPVGWHRDLGALAWAGEIAERLSGERLIVQSVIRADLLADAIADYEPPEPDRPDQPLRVDVRIRDDHYSVWAFIGELGMAVDMERYAEYTFTKALTLAEAGAYAHSEICLALEAVQKALGLIDPELLADWHIEEGPCLVQAGGTRALHLDQLVEQIGPEAEQLAERLSERLRLAQGVPAGQPVPLKPGQLPCGCEGQPAMMLRRLDFAQANGLLFEQFQSAAVCAAFDCRHQTAFIPRLPDDARNEENWRSCRDGMRRQRFGLDARPVHDLHGRKVGAVVMGHNAATPICDGPLVRALADACGLEAEQEGQLTMLTATINLSAVGLPDADPDLLARELAAVARDAASDRHVQAPKVELRAQFSCDGERYGDFNVGELIVHPVERIMRNAPGR